MRYKIHQNPLDVGKCNDCEFLKRVTFDNGTTQVLCVNFHAILPAKVVSCSFFKIRMDEDKIDFRNAWDTYIDDDGDLRWYNPRVQQNRIKGMKG